MTEGYNWFDGVVAATLLWAAARGWRRGGAWEFREVLKWAAVLVLAALIAPLGAGLADALGLSRFGGRLCAYGWTLVLVLWFASAMSWGRGRLREAEEQPPRWWGRLGGALLGGAHGALLVAVGLAFLAMIPGGLTRFADLRQAVLCDSYSGWTAAGYWERLAPEFDPGAEGFNAPRLAEFSDFSGSPLDQ